ncbi:MAG: DUF2019 domain-containing protein [Pseudorhodoplanes sp.]|nr:DUF2019 domain-containing protein [Pseudorhodoplanes sp.]
MKPESLKKMGVEALVERFADIGVAQDKALLYDEIGKFNRLYDQKTAVLDELKSRPGDQRRALIPLYNHPNMQVRLNAAKATLAVVYPEAYRMLEAIADSGWHPQAGDAGMSLSNLERGIFKLE